MALYEALVVTSWNTAGDVNQPQIGQDYPHQLAQALAKKADLDFGDWAAEIERFSSQGEAHAAAAQAGYLWWKRRIPHAVAAGAKQARLGQDGAGFFLLTRTVLVSNDTRDAAFLALPGSLDGVTAQTGDQCGIIQADGIYELTITITTEGVRRSENVADQPAAEIAPAPNELTCKVVAEETVLDAIDADSNYEILTCEPFETGGP